VSKTQASENRVGIVFPNNPRTRVPDTKVEPAKWVGQLRTTWPNGDISVGTATLIGQKFVLTCAHNFFNASTQQECKSAVFGPGFNRTAPPESAAVAPFGTYELKGWKVPEDYVNRAAPTPSPDGILQDQMGLYLNDFAIGELQTWARPDLDRSSFVVNGLALANGQGCHINGYSGDLDNSSHTQYTRSGPVQLDEGQDFVTYQMSTSRGDSGSPIYYKSAKGPYWNIVGVHVSGVADVGNPANGFNFGPWLVGDRLNWILDHTA